MYEEIRKCGWKMQFEKCYLIHRSNSIMTVNLIPAHTYTHKRIFFRKSWIRWLEDGEEREKMNKINEQDDEKEKEKEEAAIECEEFLPPQK